MNDENVKKVRAWFDARPAYCEAHGVIIDAGDWRHCHEVAIANFEHDLATGALRENLRWDAYLGLPSFHADARVIIDRHRAGLGRDWNGREDNEELNRLLTEAGF